MLFNHLFEIWNSAVSIIWHEIDWIQNKLKEVFLELDDTKHVIVDDIAIGVMLARYGYWIGAVKRDE